MRAISRTLQIPALPINWLGESGIEIHAVHAICNLDRPQISVEHALWHITRRWCIVKRTYIVRIGSNWLTQEVHDRLAISRVEATPGVVILLVRWNGATCHIGRRHVDGFADDVRRLLAIIEEWDVRGRLGRCRCSGLQKEKVVSLLIALRPLISSVRRFPVVKLVLLIPAVLMV